MAETKTIIVKDYWNSQEIMLSVNNHVPGLISIGTKQDDGNVNWVHLHEHHLVNVINLTKKIAQQLSAKPQIELSVNRATHRITIKNHITQQHDTKTFTLICPHLTIEAMRETIKKLFDEKITNQLKPEVIFMNEDMVGNTHTIIVSSANNKEKSYSFRVRCPSRTSNDLAIAIRKNIVDGEI